MARLSLFDQMRAEREKNLVISIRRKLRKAKLILRVCGKRGSLHISAKSDYERKATECRRDTTAYQELSYNPLEEIIKNITSAVKDLKEKKQLRLYR